MLAYIVVVAVACVTALLVPCDWAAIYGDAVSVFGSLGPSNAPARIISKSELSKYSGEVNSPGLYVAILGQVFDVKKGEKHYGPGGGYHFFAGSAFVFPSLLFIFM